MGRRIKLHSYIYEIQKEIYKRKELKGNANSLRHDKDVTIGHVTYYKIGNAGDTALSQCVRKTFERNLKANWEIFSVNEDVNEELIKKINETRALVIGGGGLFLPDTNTNMISGWQWAVSPERLKEITVPIFVFSVGYNYFRNQVSNELFRENLILLCEKAKFVGLRNHGSVETVKNLLPEELQGKIMFQPCTTTIIRKIYGDLIPKKVSGKRIAINMAFDREEQRFGEAKEEILTEIAKAAKRIEERGYEIILVYHVSSDQKIKPYMDAMNVHYKEKRLMNAFPSQIYQFYNGIELVIGMRGHAQMIPFGLNCEIISLVTHNKMRWFLEDIDALDWQIDFMSDFDGISEKIVKKFIDIHERNHELTKARLYKAQEKLWKVTQSNMEIIGRILNNKK